MSFKSQKNTFWDLLFLAALSSIFLLFYLGNGSLASWDEGIYASVAKGIVQSGDWLKLTLGGEPWADKPPLGIWITAFFYKLFGINEFSARLFSALCGIGTVMVTYLLGRKLLNRWTGFLGALVLLSSSHFLRFARFGMLDAPLTFFLSLSLYWFWLGHERNRYLIFSGITLGLAIMTKGFAALLAFPVIWIYCWWADELGILTRSSYWIGVMIAVAIALPWNLYELLANREVFMQDVVMKHLFVRTQTALDGHGGNLYFYVRTLVNKYHPWILVGVVSAPFFLFKAVKDREREIIFLSVWMFFIFGVVTLIRTKLPWYIFPVYPALSLSVAYFLARMFKEEQVNFIRGLFIVIMILHINFSHIFSQDYSADIKGMAAVVKPGSLPDGSIYLYQYHESPAVAFYFGKKSIYLDDKASFLSAAEKDERFVCLVHEKHLKPLEKHFGRLGLSIGGSFKDLRLLQK